MKNIFVTPTEEDSSLCIRNFDNKLCQHNKVVRWHGTNQYMYITSSDEIKDGEWHMSRGRTYPSNGILEWCHKKGYAKIILTTDPLLIKDGVSEISDDFIKWYTKNQIDFVEVEHCFVNKSGRKVDLNNVSQNHSECKWIYKPMIPFKMIAKENRDEALSIASDEYGERGKHTQILVDPIMDRAICRSNSFESGANWESQRNLDMVHYDKAAYEEQIPRMKNIGIDTIGQSFEEMVSEVISMSENKK
jgi:hypothetical protein